MWFVVKGGWPQMILLFLIMRCTPTIRELIEATHYRRPLHRLPVSRLLLPRSGLERSDFVRWHETDMAGLVGEFRSRGNNGSQISRADGLLLTPSRHKREDFAATHKLMGERPG